MELLLTTSTTKNLFSAFYCIVPSTIVITARPFALLNVFAMTILSLSTYCYVVSVPGLRAWRWSMEMHHCGVCDADVVKLRKDKNSMFVDVDFKV